MPIIFYNIFFVHFYVLYLLLAYLQILKTSKIIHVIFSTKFTSANNQITISNPNHSHVTYLSQ